MNIVTYKCPKCDGPLEFSSELQKLKCPYCEGEFTIEEVKEYNELKAEAHEEPVEEEQTEQQEENKAGNNENDNGWTEDEKSKLRTYVCPACAAEIVAEETTGATKCIYCGNPTIIPKKFEGNLKPDYIIPFKLKKEDAVSKLKEFYKGKLLLPKAFRSENKMKEVKGIYVPFWLYDCNVDADMDYKATKVSTWSDSDYNYTKTDFYSARRSGTIDFEKVPADGSKKMDDDYMDSIEPFNYKDLVDFNFSYLSGYYADKYDVDSKENEERVNDRVRTSTENMFRNTVQGYSTVSTERSNININDSQAKYVLMPVWLLNTKYKDKIYTFAMNGQTGKFVGKLPSDKGQAFKWFLKIFIPCFIILGIIAAVQ